MQNLPYWRLSSFYFFYFGLLGCITPYWGLFLADKGFTALEIGQLMALFGVVRMVAPNLWGYLGDKSGRRLSLLRLGACLCPLIFLPVFLVDHFYPLAMVMIGYGFFWAAILPQFEVITLNYVMGRTEIYARIRVWGSLGFILLVYGLGFWFDHFSVSTLPVFMLLMLAFIAVSCFRVQAPVLVNAREHSGGFFLLLKQKAVWVFFMVACLMQISHGPYYTFFSLFLEQHQYSKQLIGFLWALGVVAEVVIFWCMSRLSARFGSRQLLLIALVITGVRWLLIGLGVDSLTILLLAQLMHAASFGIMHAVSMYYIHAFFYGEHQGQGQALFSSLAYGASSALGAVIAGWIWTHIGSGHTFVIMACCPFVAAWLAWRYMK
ncbi:MAG: MFS transporter [Oceanospirillaceae bacterium]|nr:MFS transporter [Oceanospirillaceae bacterium]MCP5334852.1 MFS transporter [Oceanospirillaceae bacterium]MCP5349523.1 MFS transporter [Oceanospirillaceae bacterium]